MIKKVVLLFFLIFTLEKVMGQMASPMLSNFIESRNIENQNWAICQDENHVMLFANRRGILAFDGEEWQTIRIPVIPYAMQKNPANGKVYIGGENHCGFLDKSPTGSYHYVSLPVDSTSIGIITKIIFDGSHAWFYSDQTILRFNLDSGKVDLRLDSKPGSHFTGMMITPKNTFINESGTGLYRIESDTLFPIVTGYLTQKTDILFFLPYNSNLVLVGFSDGNLSLFDGIKYYPYPIKDDGYLKENILSESLALSDTAYAFSTLDGGAEVVQKTSGKVLFTINNQTELPDDEIFAIGCDINGGLWLSHQYGMTRVDLNLPVRNYSSFPGLKGNLSSAINYKNELYVATSEGIYYLTEVRNYANVVTSVRKITVAESGTGKVSKTSEQEPQNPRKNIFARIFGRKTTKERNEKNAPVENKQTETVVIKNVGKLKSITWEYIKVEGINEKCRQLVGTQFGILAATNKGLFVVNNHKARLITANRYINSISWKPFNGKYYIAASDGYFDIKYQEGKWLTEIPDAGFANAVYSVILKDNKTIWLSGENIVYRTELDGDSGGLQYSTYVVKKDFPERYVIDLINDSVFLFTESGVDIYDNKSDRFRPFSKVENVTGVNDFLLPLSNQRFFRQNNEWISLGKGQKVLGKELSLLRIFDDIISIDVENANFYIIAGNNKLYCIDRMKSSEMNPATDIYIKSISNDRGINFNLSDVKFDRGDDVINFNIIAPEYLKQKTTQYQYIISKLMPEWSPWSMNTHYSRTITRPGVYILKVRAMDLWGNIGKPQSVRFTIRAPFTQTITFYIISGFAALLLIVLVVRFRERQLHAQNRILEQKVKERTAEIEAQKEEITSSIEYASRIQMAILPFEDHFKDSFSDYFIFFRPRDIVSGDFYWMGEIDNSIFFTVADCTGHGVPGAFMSTLGVSTLQEIIANNRNLKANIVLNLLREKIMTTLHQTGKEGEAADGMDIAMCVLNKEKKLLEYSGAYNPLLIFQGGELKEYKADRMPIGIHYGEEAPFTNYVINLEKGDTLYIFSDGYVDQFGGPEGSKYKKSNLKKLLSDIYYRPMAEQKNIIETEFNTWKGSGDQIDDVTIIGIRI